MLIEINSNNVELDERLRKKVEDRLAKINQHLGDYSEDEKIATIRLEKGDRWGFKMSFSMWLPAKRHLFAEGEGEEVLDVVVKVRDQIIRQIKKYKSKEKL